MARRTRTRLRAGGGSADGPILRLSPRSIAENAAIGDLVGTLSVLNGVGPYTFSITSDPDAKFAIDGVDNTRLELAASVNYEADTLHAVTISATDGVNPPIVRTFQIVVTDIEDTVPVNTVAPVISGSPVSGQTLSCSTGTWTSTNIPTYTYQWKDDGVSIGGATSSTFLLTDTQVGGNITCDVTATNTFGAATQASNSLGPVTPALAAPVNTVAPVVSGTTNVGQTLTCTTGTWTGYPTPTYAYQWREDGVAISGATASTYVLTSTEIGGNITCTVTATNSQGSASQASNSVGPVTDSLYALDLNFAAMADATVVADAGVTFSRASHATMYDSTGKLTFAPNNLVLQSQDFATTWAPQVDATITSNTTAAPDGTTTADTLTATASSADNRVQQSVSTAIGTYVFSVYAKANSSGFVWINAYDGGFGSSYTWFNLNTGAVGTVGVLATASITSVGSGWYRCAVKKTVADAGLFHIVGVSNADNTGNATNGNSVYIWGAQLERVTYETSPRAYNATTSAAYYGPRLDYDPSTLAAKGLLVEESRTNLLTYSEAFDNAAWTKGASSVTANSVTSPDGTTAADTLTENSATTEHYVSNTSGKAASSITYTASVYAKRGSSGTRNVGIGVTDGTTGGLAAVFDPDDGSVVATAVAIGSTSGWTGGSTFVQDCGNGWWRFSYTTTTNTATRVDQPVYLVSGSTLSYAGDNASNMYIYGAQLEAGSFATSYQSTGAASVTRAADAASMTGTNFSSWYNQSEGTFVADVDAVNTNIKGLFSANDGSSSNRVDIRVNDLAVVSSGGSNVALLNPGVVSNGAYAKAAVAYKLNDFGACVDGGTVSTDAAGAAPTGVDRLIIGALDTVIEYYINGHIARLRYADSRLPNATLQTETT